MEPVLLGEPSGWTGLGAPSTGVRRLRSLWKPTPLAVGIQAPFPVPLGGTRPWVRCQKIWKLHRKQEHTSRANDAVVLQNQQRIVIHLCYIHITLKYIYRCFVLKWRVEELFSFLRSQTSDPTARRRGSESAGEPTAFWLEQRSWEVDARLVPCRAKADALECAGCSIHLDTMMPDVRQWHRDLAVLSVSWWEGWKKKWFWSGNLGLCIALLSGVQPPKNHMTWSVFPYLAHQRWNTIYQWFRCSLKCSGYT